MKKPDISHYKINNESTLGALGSETLKASRK